MYDSNQQFAAAADVESVTVSFHTARACLLGELRHGPYCNVTTGKMLLVNISNYASYDNMPKITRLCAVIRVEISKYIDVICHLLSV